MSLSISIQMKAAMISSNVGTFTTLDKTTTELGIANICFKTANDIIVKEIPELKRIWPGSESLKATEGISPKKAFMRLVNNLHDQASIFFFHKTAPADLSKEARITWEYNNYDSLLATVQVGMPMRGDAGFLALVVPGKPSLEDMKKIYEEMKKDLSKTNLNKKGISNIIKVIETCENYVRNEISIVSKIERDITKIIKQDSFDIDDHIEKYKEMIAGVKNVPYSLANAYLKSKYQNTLNAFFSSFCAENIYFELVLSKVLNDYSKDIFSKKIATTSSFVNPKETKQKNFDKMLTFFLDRQTVRYARKNRIDLEKTSISLVKAKMLDDGFHIDNNTKENFLEFLREEGKIINKKAWDGIIVERDIQGFTEIAIEMGLLS